MNKLPIDVVHSIIQYLPPNAVQHLTKLDGPIGDYAFQYFYRHVEVGDTDLGGCGPLVLEYEHLLDYEELPPDRYYVTRHRRHQGILFSNIYAFRRFIDSNPRWRPHEISFESEKDVMAIHDSHPHILGAALISYTQEAQYNAEDEEDTSAYMASLARVASLPYRFNHFYIETGTSWDQSQLKFPAGLTRLVVSTHGSGSLDEAFFAKIESLDLAYLSVHSPICPPVLSSSIQKLHLGQIILKEDFALEMPCLRELTLGGESCEDINIDLQGSPLVTLTLRYMPLSSLARVSFPSTLRSLSISALAITSLEGILDLPLHSLSVARCSQIQRLEFPVSLRKLELSALGSENPYLPLAHASISRYYDSTLQLPPNLTTLSLAGRGIYELRGSLVLPKFLRDLYLDNCFCRELPLLPDTLEYVRVHTEGLVSVDNVLWPSSLISLSVRDDYLASFPLHKMRGICLESLSVEIPVRKALKNYCFGSPERLLVGSLYTEPKKREESEKEKTEQEVSTGTEKSIEASTEQELPPYPSSLFYHFPGVGLEYKHGKLIDINCIDLGDIQIPPSVERLRSIGHAPRELHGLRELSLVTNDVQHAQELVNRIPSTVEKLTIQGPDNLCVVSFNVASSHLKSLSLTIRTKTLDLQCPNLTTLKLSRIIDPFVNVDLLPRGLVELSISGAFVETVGDFSALSSLESLDLSDNYLGQFLADHTLALPPSLVHLDLSDNNLTRFSLELGPSMEVVSLRGNENIAWEGVRDVCEHLAPRTGLCYVSLREPEEEIIEDMEEEQEGSETEDSSDSEQTPESEVPRVTVDQAFLDNIINSDVQPVEPVEPVEHDPVADRQRFENLRQYIDRKLLVVVD